MNVTLIAGLLVIDATLHAQTFDVVSIKRSAPANPNSSTFEFLIGGGMRVKNGTLLGLIESAYDVREFQIVGGPSWLNADRYDVLARSRSGEVATISAEEMKATRLKLRAYWPIGSNVSSIARHVNCRSTPLSWRRAVPRLSLFRPIRNLALGRAFSRRAAT